METSDSSRREIAFRREVLEHAAQIPSHVNLLDGIAVLTILIDGGFISGQEAKGNVQRFFDSPKCKINDNGRITFLELASPCAWSLRPEIARLDKLKLLQLHGCVDQPKEISAMKDLTVVNLRKHVNDSVRTDATMEHDGSIRSNYRESVGHKPLTDRQRITARIINERLDACEARRSCFKKKLDLSALEMRSCDVPVKDFYHTSLGNSLHTLSLAKNSLSVIPSKLVLSFPALKKLDLSQCNLYELPDNWELPKLKYLDLSHNRLTDFPHEVCLLVLPFSVTSL